MVLLAPEAVESKLENTTIIFQAIVYQIFGGNTLENIHGKRK